MTNKIVKMTVVDADGEIITAANNLVSSDNSELVRLVKLAAKIRTEVQFVAPFGRTVQAELNPENPVGIAAALFAARPGRTRLLEAPSEVWDWLEEDYDNNSEPGSYSADMSAENREKLLESSLADTMRLLGYDVDEYKETEK